LINKEFEQEIQKYADLILQKVEKGETSIEKMNRIADDASEHPADPVWQGYVAARAQYQPKQEGE
jgi:hypothetical protein